MKSWELIPFGRIKNNALKNSFYTVEYLVAAIQHGINTITPNELERVFQDIKCEVNLFGKRRR